MSREYENFELLKKRVIIEKEHSILKDGLVKSTKLMHENSKYYNYDRDELEMLVTMYHDIIEHINVFLIELKGDKQ